MTDLLIYEQIKQPALTVLVAKLESDGLITRRRDPDDGRAMLLSLTEAGEEVVQQRHLARVERLQELTKGLSPESLEKLLSMGEVLDQIVHLANISGYNEGNGARR